MQMTMPQKFIKAIPKVELHAHLHGSVRLEMLATLLKKTESENLSLLGSQINSKIESLLQSGGGVNIRENLDECFEIFSLIHSVVIDTASLKFLVREVILDFLKDNVVYLELRTTPRETEFMTKREYMEALLEVISECEQDGYPIIVRVLVSVNRALGVDVAGENIELACEYFKKTGLVVGVDFSGNPAKGSFLDYLPILTLARDRGLKITVHCAEIDNPDEVKMIVSEFRPDRLGHMLFIQPELQDRMLNMREPIPIECCPTSNCLTLGLNDDISQHPSLGIWLQNGYPICICTDDSGVFNTTLSNEFEKVAKGFELAKSRVLQISFSALDFAFASDADKEKVRKLLAGSTYSKI